MAPAPRPHHAEMADRHLALHAHHQALSTHFEDNGLSEPAALHHGIAEHHLKMAESHNREHESAGGNVSIPKKEIIEEHERIIPAMKKHGMKEEAEHQSAELAEYKSGVKDAEPKTKPAASSGGGFSPLIGAAAQLHKAGHITDAHHARIKKAVATAKPKPKAFGSLSGAGHYMGDVDESNSAGTVGNAGSGM